MDAYIGRTVLVAVAVVGLGFLALTSLFALLDELDENEAAYSLTEAVGYVALTLPRRLYEVLPYVVFLGTLIGLGNLASRSEIVIFRTAGVSAFRIFASVVWPALFVLGLGLSVGEWIAPRGEEMAEVYKSKALEESEFVESTGGYWYREGSMVMNVRGLGVDGELLGIRQFWYDDERNLKRALSANRAVYRDDHWLLFDVIDTSIEPERSVITRAASVRWDGQVDPRVLSIRVLVEPRKLSLTDLYYQIEYMDREGLRADMYRLAFWTKILQPIAVLGLSLVALGFVFGPLRQVSMGVRLSVGILVGLTFKYLQDLLAPMSIVYDLPAVFAVAVPIAVCWILGIVGMRRAG